MRACPYVALTGGLSNVKVSRMEFVLLWATFVAIMLTDLERGIGIGIIMAVLYFAYSYAQAGIFSPAAPHVTGGNSDATVHLACGASSEDMLEVQCCQAEVLLPLRAPGQIGLNKSSFKP